jgi:hypothetical protein
MGFVHFLLKSKQVHNLKNRVFPHIISDYMENPPPTFFVNSLENSTISTLCVKNLRKIGHFEIWFLSIYTECPQKKDESIAPLFIGGF